MKHNALRRIAASIIGIVFVISGLLKMLDVTGTGLIVGEYFKFFHLGFLTGISRATAIVLCLLETITGAALITGSYRKLTAIVTSVILGLFTVITLILLIAKPEMDCGCFGQAIHLSHLQSFVKNLVLVALCLGAFLPYKDFGKPKRCRVVTFWIGVVSISAAMLYLATHLPIVDFTDFHPGAKIYAAMDSTQKAVESYHATYIYEKDGKKESFTLDKLPDSTWAFVKVDTVFRSSPASSAPVLSFSDEEGNYHDEAAAKGSVIVISVYDPDNCDWMIVNDVLHKISDLHSDVRPIVLLNTSPGSNVYIPSHITYFYADYKTLITLNRANGGATFMVDGEILRKWRPADFPATQDLKEITGDDITAVQIESVTPGRIWAEGFALFLLALLIFL